MNQIIPSRFRTLSFNHFIKQTIQIWRAKSAQDFLLTAGSNFAVTVFTAMGGILAARLLGPEGRGEFAVAIVWAAVLSAIATIGLPQALTFFVARDPSAVGTIFSTTLMIWLVQSSIALLSGWVAIDLLLAHLRSPATESTRLYLFSIPPVILTTYLSTMAQGLKRFGLFNAIRLAASITYPLSIGLGILLGLNRTVEIVALMLSFLVFSALVQFGIFLMCVRPVWSVETVWAKHLLAYGTKSYWGSLSWVANARLDQFVMSAIVGMDALGQYAVAVSYSNVLFPVTGAFATILFPRVAEDQQNAGARILRILKLNLGVSVTGALALGIICSVALPFLFGSRFTLAVNSALVLLLGTVFLSANYVLSDGLRGLGRPFATTIAEIAGLLVTLVGLIALLPYFGILGAAITSVASYMTVFIILYWAVRT
ncbi:MAG: oligosaccharide flippase family protein [Chloroflexi bacterium]|nr:oligosaccharide flippase family protein [Chloroflexota bacterium]